MLKKNRFLLACGLALAPLSAYASNGYTVCIDPGHGGTDPGAVAQTSFGCVIQSLATPSGTLEEADVALDIGLTLRDYLLRSGFDAVYMTRDTDVFPSLSDRTRYANSKGCTRFVSIHNNSSGTANTATGTETYCYSGNSLTSKGCVQAQNIQNEMQKVWPINNRGRKQAGFYVIKNTNMPATLSELAFINNCVPDVNSYLSVASKRDDAALAHLYALQTSLGLSQGLGSGSGGGSSGGSSDAGTGGGQQDAGSGGNGNGGSGNSGSTDAGTSNPTVPSNYGTVKGLLYEGVDSTKRIPNGTITIGGQTVRANGNGVWQFDSVAAGEQTVWASADGYLSTSRSCTVKANEDVWCSVSLQTLPAAATTGTLHGIVYQNGNYNDLVSPAHVTLNASGVTVMYRGGADWSFELEPGVYTVTVEAAGYETKTYACPVAVATGSASACNVELTKIGGGNVGVSSGSGNGSSSSGTDWWNNGDEEIDDMPGSSNGNTSGNASSGTSSSGNGGVQSSSSAGLFACSSTGGEASGAGVLALLTGFGFAFAARRRRFQSMKAMPVLVGAAVLGTSAMASADEGQRISALKTESFVQAGSSQTFAAGKDYMAPVISPDGKRVAFTRGSMKGLYVLDTKGGEIQTITEDDNAGYAPAFSRDSQTISYRAPGQALRETPFRFTSIARGIEARPFKVHSDLTVYQTKHDAIILRQGSVEKVVAASANDKFFHPVLTADGAWVIYSGLYSGLYGYRIADETTFFFGKGSQPSVSEDGRYLVFSKTEDDGQDVTKAVLHVADLKAETPKFCEVNMGSELVLHPNYNAATSTMVFSNGKGDIRIMKLEIR